MPYNENPDIHSREITWAEYKQLVSANRAEKDKIYFVADLENREDMVKELIEDMKILKQIIGIDMDEINATIEEKDNTIAELRQRISELENSQL